MKRAALMLVCALLAAALVGCKPPEVSPVYGSYIADYAAATETLTLKPDGTFVQSVTLRPHGKPVTSTGHWHFDQPTAFVIFDSGYIEVLDLLGRPRPDYAQPLSGEVFMPVVRCLGRLYIGSGRFVLYAKKEPSRIPYATQICGALF
ncbi:MAG TPA: hypothetical protein VMV15_07250 [Candidatus Binataceae bacterium]|nr:hypothetical protein [Candidatus Binataceae bacterium]